MKWTNPGSCAGRMCGGVRTRTVRPRAGVRLGDDIRRLRPQRVKPGDSCPGHCSLEQLCMDARRGGCPLTWSGAMHPSLAASSPTSGMSRQRLLKPRGVRRKRLILRGEWHQMYLKETVWGSELPTMKLTLPHFGASSLAPSSESTETSEPGSIPRYNEKNKEIQLQPRAGLHDRLSIVASCGADSVAII